MKLTDYHQLDFETKLEVTNCAVCIGGRNEGKFMVLLYQLDGFYIEVYYHKKYSYINSLHAFDDMELLDPYLEKLALPVTI